MQFWTARPKNVLFLLVTVCWRALQYKSPLKVRLYFFGPVPSWGSWISFSAHLPKIAKGYENCPLRAQKRIPETPKLQGKDQHKKRCQTQHAVSIAPGRSSCGMDEKFDVGNWEVVWNRGSVGWRFKMCFVSITEMVTIWIYGAIRNPAILPND